MNRMRVLFTLPLLCKGVASLLGVFAVTLLSSGCATQPVRAVVQAMADEPPPSAFSPAAEEVSPREAWRLAEAYARAHPGCEVLVGSGTSMLPLYPDKTVLVVAHVAMSQLRRGMTVIFIGDSGRPVAHLLVEKTPRGWRTRGAGNDEEDRTRVRSDNYIGTVVKAYTPTVRSVDGMPAQATVAMR